MERGEDCSRRAPSRTGVPSRALDRAPSRASPPSGRNRTERSRKKAESSAGPRRAQPSQAERDPLELAATAAEVSNGRPTSTALTRSSDFTLQTESLTAIFTNVLSTPNSYSPPCGVLGFVFIWEFCKKKPNYNV